MESTVYKINKIVRYSGVFYGPVTTVYGFGVLAILLVNKYFLSKLKVKKILKIIIIIITFIVLMLILTLIEFLGGTILHNIFHFDMWNYTNKDFNIGKYISLDLALTWGLFGIIFLYVVKPFMDKIIAIIPNKVTIFSFFVFLIDIFATLITK